MKASVKLNLYGSLRKGQYNYDSFVRQYGEDSFVYNGTKRIPGFELYSLGSYPMVLATPEAPRNTLVVDEMMVSEECYQGIRRMELGAGYHEVILDDGAIIYAHNDNRYDLPKVDSGDWSAYLDDIDSPVADIESEVVEEDIIPV